MKKVSIIIPVYNAAGTLKACLDSVRGQTYPHWELILVDDGSTDGGPGLCEAVNDPRVILLRQENQGVSAARNRGLAAASGEWLFFLDSDDAIHPRLLEELVSQAEGACCQIAFCRALPLDDAGMEAVLSAPEEGDPCWTVAEEAEAEDWFHQENRLNQMQQIGGKLVDRAFAQGLAFPGELENGEDTLFVYALLERGPKAAYSRAGWYYYRQRPESLSHLRRGLENPRRFEALRIIRDQELAKGRQDRALAWERRLAYLLAYYRGREKPISAAWRDQAQEALKHPLFRQLDRGTALSLRLAAGSFPLFRLAQGVAALRRGARRWSTMEGVEAGILTFHCSDNFGAMLQSYGLKRYLTRRGVRAEIVPYEPPWLTGRHWLVPYIPGAGSLRATVGGTLSHLAMGGDFFRKRRNMRQFRRKYLTGGYRRIFFGPGLKRLRCRTYVVGSDQIWNPALTVKLRPAYFGAFPAKEKRRVAAYGASLGGSALSPRWDQAFARMIAWVDAVSLREAGAVEYVKRFRADPLTQVLDPVFLLDKEEWEQAAELPERRGYVLVFVTEEDPSLYAFARDLAKRRGLAVVELKAGKWGIQPDFITDYTAGPAEFLGYVRQADYVVTNSFHGTAFAILFEREFRAFLHSSRGERIRSVLEAMGLESRLGEGGGEEIDWEKVRRRREEWGRRSREFLEEQVVKHT